MVYSKYAGTELKVSGTEYVILKVRMVKIGPVYSALLWCAKPSVVAAILWALYTLQWHLAHILHAAYLLSARDLTQ